MPRNLNDFFSAWDETKEDEDKFEANDAVPTSTSTRTPGDILDVAERVDFENKDAVEAFEDWCRQSLSIKEDVSRVGNVLHEVSGRSTDSESGGKRKRWTQDRMQLFVNFLLDSNEYKYCHLIYTPKEIGSHMPLHSALYNKNHVFVKVVLDWMSSRGITIPVSKDKSAKSITETILQHATSDKENCLHLAIVNSSEHTETLISLCENISGTRDKVERPQWVISSELANKPHRPLLFRQRDKNGGTPLHYAAKLQATEYEIMPAFSSQVSSVPSSTKLPGINKFELPSGAQQETGNVRVSNSSVANQSYVKQQHTPPRSPQSSPQSEREIDAKTGMPVQEELKAIKVKAPPTNHDQVMLVRRLMDADPMSLMRDPHFQQSDRRLESTPFLERESNIRKAVTKKAKAWLNTINRGMESLEAKAMESLVQNLVLDELEELRANDEILSAMRNFCLEKFAHSRSTVIQSLYLPGRERHIEFSLSGMRRQKIHMDYLQRLALHLQFESVLTCVTLPRLRVEVASRSDKDKEYLSRPQSNTSSKYEGSALQEMNRNVLPRSNAANTGKGLSDLVAVFDWLREKHVKQVKKIVVLDNGDPCHSDEAIERALDGLDVTTWDWKRPDVCSEVIYKCAPRVREISLYWSGNQSVLLGWYSDEGFRNEKFKHLRKIILYYQKGVESNDRISKYLKTFKERLEGPNQKEGEGAKKEGGELTNTNNNGGAGKESSEEPKEQSSVKKPKVYVELHEDPDNHYLLGFKGAGESLTDNAWFSAMKPILECVQTIPQSMKQLSIAIIDDGIDASLPIFDGRIAWGASFGTSLGSEDSATPYFVSSGHHGTLMAALTLRLCPAADLYIAKLDERYTSTGGRHITARSAAEAINWAVDAKVDIISMSWTIEVANAKSKDVQSRDLKSLENAVQRAEDKGILMFCAASDQGNSSMIECYPGQGSKCVRVGAATGTGERCAWVHPDNYDYLLPGEKITYDLQDPSSPPEHSGSSVATAVAAGLAGLIKFLHRQHDPEAAQDGFCKKTEIERAFRYLGQGHPFPAPDKLGFLASKHWNNGLHQKAIKAGLKKLFDDIKDSTFKHKFEG